MLVFYKSVPDAIRNILLIDNNVLDTHSEAVEY